MNVIRLDSKADSVTMYLFGFAPPPLVGHPFVSANTQTALEMNLLRVCIKELLRDGGDILRTGVGEAARSETRSEVKH